MTRFFLVLAWLSYALAVVSGLFTKADAVPLRAYTMALGCFFLGMAIYHRIGDRKDV